MLASRLAGRLDRSSSDAMTAIGAATVIGAAPAVPGAVVAAAPAVPVLGLVPRLVPRLVLVLVLGLGLVLVQVQPRQEHSHPARRQLQRPPRHLTPHRLQVQPPRQWSRRRQHRRRRRQRRHRHPWTLAAPLLSRCRHLPVVALPAAWCHMYVAPLHDTAAASRCAHVHPAVAVCGCMCLSVCVCGSV